MDTCTMVEEDISIFRQVFNLYIRPLVNGIDLIGPFTDEIRVSHPVVEVSPDCVRVFVPKHDSLSFVFQKEKPFTGNEKNLIEQIMRRIHGQVTMPVQHETGGQEAVIAT
ncbi:hypothetical protein LJC19_00030 [Oxalobacter sp. OttesenSCG-928-P03]|nr:hypothetical protein [Oxalobacter sp. OttesenSCG-928-P03]